MADEGAIPLGKSKDQLDVVTNPHPSQSGRYQGTVRDVARQRAWSGEGNTSDEAATEALRGFLADRRSPDYLPRR
jgi:hypothetical protein